MTAFCKARTLNRGEKVFHAPKECEGYYEMTFMRGYRCPHCEVRNDSRFCHYVGKTVAYNPTGKLQPDVLAELIKSENINRVWDIEKPVPFGITHDEKHAWIKGRFDGMTELLRKIAAIRERDGNE